MAPQINSILINKYEGSNSYLPKHSDREATIHPESSIFTLSLGQRCVVKFTERLTGMEVTQTCPNRSLYTMSRRSQEVYDHEIEQGSLPDGIRYSLTFRSVSWMNKNSTSLHGDSNTRFLRFGSNKRGTFGEQMPGQKFWAPKIRDIDPVSCMGYSNVVLLCGINDIKESHIKCEKDVADCYAELKLKIKQIKLLSPSTKAVFVCQLLPTKDLTLNRKVNDFNKLLHFDLFPNCKDVEFVEGFGQFVCNRVLAAELSMHFDRLGRHDMLHLNRAGGRVLASLIKQSIFHRFHGGVDKRRHTGRVNGRLYSNVVETRLHTSGMVDGCQNIDGNKTNFDAFSLEMERVAEKFQIIGLAETNITAEESHVYQLEGYNSFYQTKHINKLKGSGVAIYVNESLNAVVDNELSWVTKNLETLFITIQHNEPLHVGILYRPPSGDSTEALNELKKIIGMCPNKNVYLLGDFNINMHDKSSKLVGDFENIIFGFGLTPLISTFTHHKPGCNKTCIDNILTNSCEKVIQSGTMSTCISHHHAIFSIFKSPIITENSQSGQKHFQYYDYNNKNVNKFVNQLEFKLISEPPNNFSEFLSEFNDQLDKACKLERPKCSKRTAKNNPWITQGLITSIDSKHELYNNWKKAEKQKCLTPNLQSDNRGRCSSCSNCIAEVARHKEFTVYRRSLNHLINSAKRKYHGEKISECAGDSKKTWQIINNLRGKKTRVIKPNFIIDDERVTNRRVIANEFNKYFASLASNLNEAYSGDYLRINPMPSFTDYLPTSISSSIYLRECDGQEIIEIISELKNGKSSDIPIHVIKKSTHIIAPYLVKYFNRCMQDGFFPCELKTGRISPIYKKEDEQLLENYRPVSTLPVFGKIFEKIIYSRLYSFLISKGVINENQFGFRKGHSTSNALNYSVEHIESLLAKKQHVLGIFIDLSKAFDTIDHRKLTTKLEHYGIRGNALQLISSYLSNRKQYVNVLDIKSDELPVHYGVPQGSVLGPLLFILYINDICNISTDAKLVLFADDTNIFVAAESISKVYEIANKVTSRTSLSESGQLQNPQPLRVRKQAYPFNHPRKTSLDALNP
ncbi:hypothetical protein ACHWQZ_G015666 [Mnemiopsis leidyi]